MPITPTITTTSTPMVLISPSLSTSTSASVSSPQVTYSQILASLGTMVYGGEFIYLASDTFQQVGQIFAYVHFNSNGDRIETSLPFTIDPYQDQPTIYYETNPKEIILDGFSSLSFTLNANSTLYFKIYTVVSSMSMRLNELHYDNFQDLERIEGFGFYNEFCNYLIDEEDVNTEGVN
jgi:hypothetical protein